MPKKVCDRAKKIKRSLRRRGKSAKEAERIAWATAYKQLKKKR